MVPVGSLGAVVVLLMWCYVSASIVLAGAELNSRSKRQLADSETVDGHGLLVGVVPLSIWSSVEETKMRLTALTLIGALGLIATAASAQAAPVVPTPDAHQAPGIVQVWGGCGPGGRPVPGHWSPYRGMWVPPHCAPAFRPYGYYGGGYGGYGGGNPYWHHRYYPRWGY